MPSIKTLKICKNGHKFYKSSDCPNCPTCEKEKDPATGFLADLGSPARNSLLYHGIDTIEKLAKHTEREILKLHGVGKASLPILQKSLAAQELSFRVDDSSPARKVTSSADKD